MSARVFFGQFALPVKASRIQKPARRASDVTVYRPDDQGGVKQAYVIERKGMGHARREKGWEPEEVVKTVGRAR